MAKSFSDAQAGGRPAFIYYYGRQHDGRIGGIRVSSSHAWAFEGEAALGPDRMEIQSEQVAIPIGEEYTGQVSEVAEMFSGSDPELSDVLSGRVTFPQALDTGEIALPPERQ